MSEEKLDELACWTLKGDAWRCSMGVTNRADEIKCWHCGEKCPSRNVVEVSVKNDDCKKEKHNASA